MATSGSSSPSLGPLLLLLLLSGQPWVGTGVHMEAVVCAGTACYTAHWSKLSAAEAQENCTSNGGNLATVKSEEEAQLIQQVLAQLLRSEVSPAMRTRKFWIGLQREKGKCYDSSLPLKGFSWVGGGEDTLYTNWHKELKSSCISKRCVSLMLDPSMPPLANRLPKWSESPCGTSGSPGSNIEGFVCKFNFQGMCRPLALGGPGQVSYITPFQVTSSSLEAVPFGSMANVVCGNRTESQGDYLLCKEKGLQVFQWNKLGPLCVSPEYGCGFNNGGCHQECFEGGDGSFRCGCRPGFRLLDDLVTCTSRNPCSSNPCTGEEATCVPEPHGKSYVCHCPHGYRQDSSQRGCVDVDECQDSPCAQKCVNTPGSYRCECWVGYEPGGPGQEVCLDVDECAPGRSPCAQGCTNTDGSFHCSCEEGYLLGEDGTQCQDVDECASPGGSPCDGLCFNIPGSFRCGCLPGREMAPDGVSCLMVAVSPGLSSEPPQQETEPGREGSTVAPAPESNATRGPEGTSQAAPKARSPLLLLNHSTTWAASGGLPDFQLEPGIQHTTAAASLDTSIGADSVATQSIDGGAEGQKLLLFYILGTVVAIALLLALALGLLVYRKRRARKEEMKEKKKPQSAADGYSWVPERAESRATENPYSPTPGTDC
ncbi:complement component C1q receptor [Ochotona curzoniae]|uniref:complement component C1q receptor n=1 Tax=Ochotona curzoniae TaxID=130825 RepID=UPI001B34B9FB|nr:complement component C1q receptor [Ochotona curzoniae]